MAIHVYMSVEELDLFQQPSADTVLNYRGEAGPNDDPKSFQTRMACRGHLVLLTGAKIEGSQQRGAKNGPESVLYRQMAKGVA